MNSYPFASPAFTVVITKSSEWSQKQTERSSLSTNSTINSRECSKSRIRFVKKTVWRSPSKRKSTRVNTNLRPFTSKRKPAMLSWPKLHSNATKWSSKWEDCPSRTLEERKNSHHSLAIQAVLAVKPNIYQLKAPKNCFPWCTKSGRVWMEMVWHKKWAKLYHISNDELLFVNNFCSFFNASYIYLKITISKRWLEV